MDLRDYMSVLRTRWLTILIVTIAIFGAATAVTVLITPRYTATTRLFFAVEAGESVTDLAQGSSYAENQMTSYAEVATSPLVLTPIIRELALTEDTAELASAITVTVPPKTVILQIAASDADPEQARRIADGVGAQLSKVAADLSPERPGGGEAVRATILAPALVPTDPSSPNVVRNLTFGLVLGLLVGIVLALTRQLLDTKIRSEKDLDTLAAGPILGVVPFDGSAPQSPIAMHDDPLGARSEAMRRLRTNLQFVELAEGGRSIIVTSSIPGEGKSTTAINLAVTLADSGLKVLLVDADLRRPSIATYLGLEGAVGLTTVLIGRAELSDVVQRWQDGTLDILPSGQIPPNPSELLGSKAMSALLRELTSLYDMVILDTSPLLPVADAVVLSKSVDGTLVVVGAERTHKPQLREALSSLATVDAHILGLVLNKVAKQNSSNYVYYTGYGPDSQAHADVNPEDLPSSAALTVEAPLASSGRKSR